jgi:hypothetical protein
MVVLCLTQLGITTQNDGVEGRFQPYVSRNHCQLRTFEQDIESPLFCSLICNSSFCSFILVVFYEVFSDYDGLLNDCHYLLQGKTAASDLPYATAFGSQGGSSADGCAGEMSGEGHRG